MPKTSLIFDESESYCLLVATEMVRQMFGDENGGIPLISQIRSIFLNREYAEMAFVFDDGAEGDWKLEVRVPIGDLWPKEGKAILKQVAVAGAVLGYSFRLEGRPDLPVVRFPSLKVGG